MKPILRRLYRAIPFKQPIYEQLRRRAELPPWLWQHLHFNGQFKVDLGDVNFQLRCDGDVVENDLFWRGYGRGWEAYSLRVWQRLARAASGVVLDIGANTGVYALAAAALNMRACVIAFEPVARIAQKLDANVRLNNFPIRIERQAVSLRTGSAVIHDGPGDNFYSASLEDGFISDGSRDYEIRTVALDDYLANERLPPVSLIKLDVETHEAAAVGGMLETLKRDRPSILIEILNEDVASAVQRLIDGLGYRVFGINEESGLVRLPRLTPMGGHHWNNLLCTQERFDAASLMELTCAAPASSVAISRVDETT